MKLGIVGTGMIVQMIAPYMTSWGIDVAAVCGTKKSHEATKATAQLFGAAVYDDYSELLADTTVDTIYIAVPNFLHASFSKQALMAGKHVICEKPFTSNIEEAREVAELAKEKHLLIYEAISTLYLPNYLKVKEWLGRIGKVKVASLNYSQYSSRYDRFVAGEVLPVFDPKKSGGALMDLGLYNVQYALGLFGAPKHATYLANIERNIDTSGVLTMDYEDFKAVCVAAKDCAAPSRVVIQGTLGYILQDTPTNNCTEVSLHLNDGTVETFSENPSEQWAAEFQAFKAGIDAKEYEGCYQMLDHTLSVSKTMTEARRAAGIYFTADEAYVSEDK